MARNRQKSEPGCRRLYTPIHFGVLKRRGSGMKNPSSPWYSLRVNGGGAGPQLFPDIQPIKAHLVERPEIYETDTFGPGC